MRWLERVNKELLLVFSLFVLAGLLNSLVASQRVVLGLYTLPTVVSAYLYGRRHATLTAFASVLLVGLLTWYNRDLLGPMENWTIAAARWLDVTIWGGTLIITGYLMGTLCDHQAAQLGELRETYEGVLLILRHFISKDQYTENHSYRVSVYASKIAAALDFGPERIEDVRAAALLHDIGKLDVSREVLYKAARLNEGELAEMRTHVDRGVVLLEPVGGTLRRVIPIILAHHDKFDGSGYHPTRGRGDPDRIADHLRSPTCLRLLHERPSLSEGDDAIRGPRDDRERIGHRVRSGRRRRVSHDVPPGRNGSLVRRRLRSRIPTVQF